MSWGSIEDTLQLFQVRDLVGADVSPAEPLAAQGLDSLAGMELRQKLQVTCRFQNGAPSWSGWAANCGSSGEGGVGGGGGGGSSHTDQPHLST